MIHGGDLTQTYRLVFLFAIQQTSVSLDYSRAPLLGGELAGSVGFPSVNDVDWNIEGNYPSLDWKTEYTI